WSNTGSGNYGRYSHTASVLANGQVLVVGGLNGVAFSNAELYDPLAAVWTT
ncbi:unnamed protein product, partial [Rotaria sp. Silwood1]